MQKITDKELEAMRHRDGQDPDLSGFQLCWNDRGVLLAEVERLREQLAIAFTLIDIDTDRLRAENDAISREYSEMPKASS